MMANNHWPMLWSFMVALVLMLAMDYFFNWWLLPDLVFIVLLQWLLQERLNRVWWVVVPISLILDMAGQTLLGFHGMVYGLMAICVTPLVVFWLRASLLEQTILLIVLSVGYIVVRTLAIYIMTGMPAPNGWYWPIFTQLLSWPFMLLIREAFIAKSMNHQ